MAQVVVAGSFIQDLVFSVDTLPSPGETRIARLSTGPGGKGSNQAIACSRQGVKTLFIGAVGDDVAGREYAEFARREGLETALEVRRDAHTGRASILVDRTSQNMIAVAPGASERLSVEHVEGLRSRIERASVLLVQLEANLAAVERALEIARAAGVTTILNPAPIHADVSAIQLAHADILTPNETEFAHLLEQLHGVRLPARFWEEPDEALDPHCRVLGCPTIVLTLGEHGAFVSRALEPPLRVPAARVHPVDTTGAGDAFSGALAAGLVHHKGDLLQALHLATAAAGLSTQKAGAALSMPTAEEVRGYLGR